MENSVRGAKLLCCIIKISTPEGLRPILSAQMPLCSGCHLHPVQWQWEGRELVLIQRKAGKFEGAGNVMGGREVSTENMYSCAFDVSAIKFRRKKKFSLPPSPPAYAH